MCLEIFFLSSVRYWKTNKKHLKNILVSDKGEHLHWIFLCLGPRQPIIKTWDIWELSILLPKYHLHVKQPLAFCSANILCCLAIYQPSYTGALCYAALLAVWSSWAQWQSFHIHVKPLQHLSDTKYAMNQGDQQKLTAHLSICLFVLTLGVPLNSGEQLGYEDWCNNKKWKFQDFHMSGSALRDVIPVQIQETRRGQYLSENLQTLFD